MIKIENVRKRLSSFSLNIDLEINRGEIFGIIGMSGSGKSTLLKIIQGIVKSDSGRVVLPREVESAYIFQELNLLHNKNIYDNVALPLIIGKKYDSNRIEEALGFVGMLSKKDSYPSELSGGEKQRVAIARALVMKPALLLCDEVTASLDEFIRNDILDLFEKINRKYGTTILIVTHELDVAKRLCNRAAVIEKGCIVDIFPVRKEGKVDNQDSYSSYVREVLG